MTQTGSQRQNYEGFFFLQKLNVVYAQQHQQNQNLLFVLLHVLWSFIKNNPEVTISKATYMYQLLFFKNICYNKRCQNKSKRASLNLSAYDICSYETTSFKNNESIL